MSQQVIHKGSRAVVINDQNGHVWANLYVNAKNGLAEASITSLIWRGKTVQGALRWAAKKLDGAE